VSVCLASFEQRSWTTPFRMGSRNPQQLVSEPPLVVSPTNKIMIVSNCNIATLIIRLLFITFWIFMTTLIIRTNPLHYPPTTCNYFSQTIAFNYNSQIKCQFNRLALKWKELNLPANDKCMQDQHKYSSF